MHTLKRKPRLILSPSSTCRQILICRTPCPQHFWKYQHVVFHDWLVHSPVWGLPRLESAVVQLLDLFHHTQHHGRRRGYFLSQLRGQSPPVMWPPSGSRGGGCTENSPSPSCTVKAASTLIPNFEHIALRVCSMGAPCVLYKHFLLFCLLYFVAAPVSGHRCFVLGTSARALCMLAMFCH